MSNVIEMSKRWITNRDVANAVMTLDAENKALKELISEVLSIVQRNTSEMTVIKESVHYLTELTVEMKEIAAEGTRTTDEIKHTKFIGQDTKILPNAIKKAEEMSGDAVRKLIRRAAKKHKSGIRKGYTFVYDKLFDVTGFDVYTVGQISLKKSDGVDGWRKDPSYINAILREGFKKETAVICMQILADK